MRTFRGITASNDWTFGQGVGSYFRREQALAADIKTSLLFFLNDCFFAMTTGVDWWNLLGAKNPAAQVNIVLQTRAAIVSREGVVRVNSVDVVVNRITRRATIRFNLDSIYSRNVSGTVQTP